MYSLDTDRLDKIEYIEEFDAICIDPRTDEVEVTKYPAKQHAKSVAKHLGVKEGLIYLVGSRTANIEDSDQPKTFRQRRYFYYLSGANFEDCIVTYDIGSDELRLFIPPVNPKTVIWLGATPSKEECEQKYDVDVVDYTSNITSYLLRALRSKCSLKLYALHKDQAPPLKERLDDTLLLPAMDAARVVKSDYEVAMVRKANVISGEAHEAALRALAWADNEAQIEATFAARCIAKQAKKQAYGIIAASGANASTLHYQANDESLRGRELICLDAGCEWDCYASDVTRSFPISGTYSKEAKEVYSIVQEMQEKCIEAIKPGVVFRNLHMLAMSIAVKGLMQLGILGNGSFAELFATGAAFFPHGLGHHIGLEVHDVSGNERLLTGIPTLHDMRRRASRDAFSTAYPYYGTQSLEPNMIVTVEPGIYFSRYAMEEVYLKNPKHAKFINRHVLEKYYSVGGVRIEDDILVTKTGYENLTTAAKGERACEIILEARKKRETSTWPMSAPWDI